MIFAYSPWIIVDFNSKTIDIKAIPYKSSLNLSENERRLITDAFAKNRIGDIKGVMDIADGVKPMPPNDFGIKIIKQGKVLSEITIDDGYNSNVPGEKKRIALFRDVVRNVLHNNADIKKSRALFLKFQTDNKVLIL